jgi:transposase InsO family protein
MKRPITQRNQIVCSFVNKEIGKEVAASLLGCTQRTLFTYTKNYLVYGVAGLIDRRRSNNIKLDNNQVGLIVNTKRKEPWRSARNIRDFLELTVHERTVWKVLVKNGLVHENNKRVKAIVRFEAEEPNDMWQTDIMGKITFKYLGDLYLIATLDDHSRFVPAGRWFKTQGKMNVFYIWYESLARYGVPKSMLQDEGSQYKARQRFGTADYQWYAKAIGTELIWAPRAQVKGKIERFWKFVQKDFVPGVIKSKSIDELNGSFRIWLAWYNYKFKSSYFDNTTHAARYRVSERRLKRVELETLLLIEERRKVTRESTISLYGKHYFVPPGYIGCRIWVKIKGNKLLMEANGHVFWHTRLRL